MRKYYPMLYTGGNGMVAHECILDLRGITKATRVTVDDVAKCLVDFGFTESGQLKKLVTAVASSGEADVARFW